MALLRFLVVFTIAFTASVESFTGRTSRQGTVTAQFFQSQQQPQSQGQGTQQIQFAPPGPQQYPYRAPQGSQQYQYAPPGGQQFRPPVRFAPPAPNQFQNYPQAPGRFPVGPAPNQFQNYPQAPGRFPVGSGPKYPVNQRPYPTPTGSYVTFRFRTISPTPIPFQSLDEAQPNVIPAQGLPTWILRYILLSIVRKSATSTTVTTTTAATRYTFPSNYTGWFSYGNCMYKSYASPKTWDDANAACVSAGSRIATINVQVEKRRNDIFGGTSLLMDKAWLGLNDIDGSTTVFKPTWLDGATFTPGVVDPVYTSAAGSRSCAFVGVAGAFTFTNCDAATQKYLCEFCPKL